MPDLVKTITELPVGDIAIGSRLRPVSEAEVAALVELMSEFGQTTPILVRKKKAGFFLIDGMHRLEATKRAGLPTIPVRVYEMTDTDARLLEASQNLVGGMSPLDDAVFLAAWKRAYLEKHPETAGGVAGALAKHGLQANSSSFAEIVAAKRAISVRQVQKVIAAGEKLQPGEPHQLRKAPRPITLADLAEISKIGEATERYDVVAALSEGRAKSAAEARRVYRARMGGVQPTVQDPVEVQFLALLNAWNRASAAARKRFRDEIEGRDE